VIQDYCFGQIKIDNQVYQSDVIAYPNQVQPNWWRDQGHVLQKKDLTEVLEFKPGFLIIGTGVNGMMTVPEKLRKTLQATTSLVIAPTPQAVEKFNQLLTEGEKVVGAFH
jgi:hypothetical protein